MFRPNVSPSGNASYGPDEMKIISTAYNEAWSEIETHFKRKNLIAQSARNRLATANIGSIKTDRLKACLRLERNALSSLKGARAT